MITMTKQKIHYKEFYCYDDAKVYRDRVRKKGGMARIVDFTVITYGEI